MEEINVFEADVKLHKSSRGIWIYIDGKHKKTIPAIFEDMILVNIEKLDFTRKHLTASERLMFKMDYFDLAINAFLGGLAKSEPHVYRLIKDAKVIWVRYVESYKGNRHELCFDNNLKLKCKRILFGKHPVKLPKAHLNY